jgi:hypothetical protein
MLFGCVDALLSHYEKARNVTSLQKCEKAELKYGVISGKCEAGDVG